MFLLHKNHRGVPDKQRLQAIRSDDDNFTYRRSDGKMQQGLFSELTGKCRSVNNHTLVNGIAMEQLPVLASQILP